MSPSLPAAERERRRHAQATVRRRRRGLGALAALAAGLGVVVGASTSDGPTSGSDAASVCREPGPGSARAAAGQRVVVRMESRAEPGLLRQARKGEIGGVILFPDPEIERQRLAAELDRLQAAARRGGNPPLLVTIDQEGGIVERIPALPPRQAPAAIALHDDLAAARREGRDTGSALAKVGISVNLAPVLDVPASPEQFMAPRAFGSTPEQVSRLGLAFAAAQDRAGVAATAKHFPGLGRARENTDFAPSAIDAGRSRLEADLVPFRDAVEAGVRLVMVSSASYPALDSRLPAVFEPRIVDGLLRDELGFAGVVVSDDLLAPAITSRRSRHEAALAATRAGVDLLLYAQAPAPGVARRLAAQAARGRLDDETLRASCERVLALKESLAEPPHDAATVLSPPWREL